MYKFKVLFLCFLVLAGLATFFVLEHTEPRLPETNQTPLLYGNQVQNDMGKSLVTAIDQAKSSIILMVYTLTDRRIIAALNRKAEENIPVEVVVDGKASSQVEARLSPKIKLLKRFGNGLMHLKILVIDKQQVWLGSANMTSDSLHMHGNLMAAVMSPPLAEAITAHAESLQPDGITRAPTAAAFLLGGQKMEIWFLPDYGRAVNYLKQLIHSAKKTIRVAMFTWTRHDLAHALVDAKRSGVDVQVALDQYAAKGAGATVVQILQRGGIPVRVSSGTPLLHYKMMEIDEKILISGSANWTRSAFTQNDDCFIVLHSLTEEQRTTLENVWKVLQSETRPVPLISP